MLRSIPPHPCVIQLVEAFRSAGKGEHIYLAFEFAHGGGLHKVRDNGV